MYSDANKPTFHMNCQKFRDPLAGHEHFHMEVVRIFEWLNWLLARMIKKKEIKEI